MLVTSAAHVTILCLNPAACHQRIDVEIIAKQLQIISVHLFQCKTILSAYLLENWQITGLHPTLASIYFRFITSTNVSVLTSGTGPII